VRLEDRVTPSGSPPTVTTDSATSLSVRGATLQATINPNGSATRARFQYSTDPSFTPTVATTLASGFNGPSSVAVDGAGDLFVSDPGNHAVKEVLPDGTIKTIGSGFNHPTGVAVDGAGDVFVADSLESAVKEVGPDGRIKTIGSGFLTPAGVAVDGAGDVFAADFGTNAVKEVLPNGTIRTIGKDFSFPAGVAVDGAGNVFVANTFNNAVKEVLPDGTIKTIGSGFNFPAGVAVDAAGDAFVADAHNNAVKEVLPNGAIRTLGPGFNQPSGVAVDAAGDVFVADQGNNRVVELMPPTVAATPSPLSGTTATAVSAELTGLSPGTTYYYRAVAAGAAGTVADLKNPPRSFQTLPSQPRTGPSTAAAASAAAAAPATGNSSTSADLHRLIRDEVLLAVDMARAAQGGLPPAAEAAAIEVLVADILAKPAQPHAGGLPPRPGGLQHRRHRPGEKHTPLRRCCHRPRAAVGMRSLLPGRSASAWRWPRPARGTPRQVRSGPHGGPRSARNGRLRARRSDVVDPCRPVGWVSVPRSPPPPQPFRARPTAGGTRSGGPPVPA
jgi:hypothetical protein